MKKVLIALGLVVVLGAAGTAGYFWWREQHITEFARTPFGSDQVRLVDIPQGTSPRGTANLLFSHGVVKSADDLYAWLRRENLGPRLKGGEYEFTGPLTPAQVIDKIVRGDVKKYHFTVPEGLRVDEILPIIADSELKLDLARLVKLSKDKAFVRKVGVPAPAETLEGFLFPDTYTFTHGATEESVLTKMVARTREEYRKADAQRKPGNRLSELESITLASIVEKETGKPEERPRISCVFHNRLKLGMKLQTDPTVLYAMMLIRGTFIKNITSKDLITEHPYNTYTVTGLPPGPIASPGAAALLAALNPPDCDDLYFVSRNDGTSVFCPDLKCHNAAVNHWQKEFFRKKPKRARH